MFVALVLLGLVLFVVGIREIFVAAGKRALPSRGAAIVVTLLGLGSCVAGGVLAPSGPNQPEVMRAEDKSDDIECAVPEGIVPGSHAAKILCEMRLMPASPEDRQALARMSAPEELAVQWKGLSAPELGDCSILGERDMMCVTGQMSFIERWPQAWKLEFVAMSEAAYCFETGCAGAVVKKPIEACAWNMVIVQSGSPYAGQGDTEDMTRVCSALTPTDQDKAGLIAKRVLG